MSLGSWQRLQYLAWAGINTRPWQDFACPGCGDRASILVTRKYLVTALRECRSCGLRFRVPLENEAASNEFYQDAYTQGFTTDCPSDEKLAKLLAEKFAGSGKDFTGYIEVLRASGLQPGDAMLDFGCSWGYGSWQFRHAGFRVYSFEVSRPRAEYARLKLSCQMVERAEVLPERVKCVFSAHVIEHLPDPNVIWKIAQATLAKDGFMACFCPNGDPALEPLYGAKRYHQLWGKVHPLMITPKFMRQAAVSHGFSACLDSSPYSLPDLAAGKSRDVLHGEELCLISKPLAQ